MHIEQNLSVAFVPAGTALGANPPLFRALK